MNTHVRDNLRALAERDYVQQAVGGGTTVSATTESTANTIVTSNALSFDGTEIILIEFFAPGCVGPNDGAGTVLELSCWLYDGASSIGMICRHRALSDDEGSPLIGKRRLAPSSGSHTFSIRASRTGTVNATVLHSGGGSGQNMPAYIRITSIGPVN